MAMLLLSQSNIRPFYHLRCESETKLQKKLDSFCFLKLNSQKSLKPAKMRVISNNDNECCTETSPKLTRFTVNDVRAFDTVGVVHTLSRDGLLGH